MTTGNNIGQPCPNCGKPVSRVGTMTQWIFRSEKCECAKPLFVSSETQSTSINEIEVQDEPSEVLERLADRYAITENLGTGNLASIDKAWDTTLKKWVAIKRLKMHNRTSEHVVRFQQEARALSRMQHANLVTVLDFGVGPDETPYMVMDFLQDKTIAEVLKERRRFSVDAAFAIAIQICDGMSHAHNKEIVHRDLNSHNMMLLQSGETDMPLVKVIDFGVAAVEPLSESGANKLLLTQPGQILGSPAYMSPEQAESKEVDARTDVYSLGCVLFEMLTGSTPFRGMTPSEIIFKHLNEAPPLLADRVPDLKFDSAVEHVVAKALAKPVEDRFQSMDEFKAALLAILFETHGLQLGQLIGLQKPAEKMKGVNTKIVMIAICAAILIFPYIESVHRVLFFASVCTDSLKSFFYGRPDLNGTLLREPDGTDKWLVMDGLRKRIPDEETYIDLIEPGAPVRTDIDLKSVPEGLAFSSDACLVQIKSRTQTYLISNQVKRSIPNKEAMRFYHFNQGGVAMVPPQLVDPTPEGTDIVAPVIETPTANLPPISQPGN